MLRNPYLNRSMIRSLDGFWGRQREVQRVMARVGASTPQSVSVVGERRIGKSSLLWHLCQPEVQARHLEGADRYLFVRLDLQGQQNFDVAGFCGELLGLVRAAAGERAPVAAGSELSDLETAAGVLEGAGLKLVVLLDEFETVTRNPAFTRPFYGFLRSLANAHPVAFVTASQRPLQELCRSQEIAESPFFNVFAQVRLGPLLEDEALELIGRPSAAAGVPLAPHAEGLLELGGRLPLFLQMACSAAFEHLCERGGRPDWGQVETAFLEEAEVHLSYLWEHFDEAERGAACSLAAGADLPPEEAGAAERLAGRGYVCRSAQRPRLFSGGFARFVGRTTGLPAAAVAAPVGVGSGADGRPAASGSGEQAAEAAEEPSLEVEPLPPGCQPFPRILGQSTAIRRVFALVQRAITSDVTVLLTGETGTGKELVARTIHEGSRRSGGPFVVVNCGSIAEQLQESELFGHKKGSFTDAVADRPGLFEAADGGTLFLDEIGDTSPSTQVRLLRVLQAGEVRRLGENHTRRVDVRLICATNRGLEAEMRAGHFRDDLYYRL
ncbi:MAG: sigma 54-interacting transcriptional regulator [Candidatus Latescibacterota bacterium]